MKRNETKAYERTPSVGCSHGIQRGGSSMSIQRGGSEKDGTRCFYTGMLPLTQIARASEANVMSQSSAKTGKCRTNVSKVFLARLWRARHMSCIFQRTDECANVIANVHGLAYRSYGTHLAPDPNFDPK